MKSLFDAIVEDTKDINHINPWGIIRILAEHAADPEAAREAVQKSFKGHIDRPAHRAADMDLAEDGGFTR